MAGLQFSDSSGLQGISEDITGLTLADTNRYSLKDRARNANQWYFRVLGDIASVCRSLIPRDTTVSAGTDNNWTTSADGSATRDISANTRGYQLPTTNKPWLIYRVALMLDGTNMYQASPFNIAEVAGLMADTDIDNNVSTDQPFYRLVGDYIYSYPIPSQDVTAGIKIWFLPEPTQFASTDTTKVPEVIFLFRRIISLGASYDWLIAHDKVAAKAMRMEIEQLRGELKAWYSQFLDDDQPPLIPDIPNYN